MTTTQTDPQTTNSPIIPYIIEATANYGPTPGVNFALMAVNEIPLDQNPAAVYLASLSRNGRITMQSSLDQVARLFSGDEKATALSLPWHKLRYQHTAAIRALLKDKYSPSSASKMLCGLRRVLKEAWRLGLMGAEEYRRAVDLSGIKSETLPRGRALAVDEIGELLNACYKDSTPAGARDGAMLVIMYGAGLRRSEIARLKLDDINLETGEVRVLAGKGNKDRLAYLSGPALEALRDWLKVRGSSPGPFFYQTDKTGKLKIKPISDEAVMRVLRKRTLQAGIENCSPHDLRRTFVSELLDAGADIATVQKLAGHADISTTARYDRRGEVAKKKAAALLKMPYKSRP